MTTAGAREILQPMLDGADPLTGEILPQEHICNYPEVMRALQTAISLMPDARQTSAKVKKTAGSTQAASGLRTILPRWSSCSNPARQWMKYAGSFSAASGA